MGGGAAVVSWKAWLEHKQQPRKSNRKREGESKRRREGGISGSVDLPGESKKFWDWGSVLVCVTLGECEEKKTWLSGHTLPQPTRKKGWVATSCTRAHTSLTPIHKRSRDYKLPSSSVFPSIDSDWCTVRQTSLDCKRSSTLLLLHAMSFKFPDSFWSCIHYGVLDMCVCVYVLLADGFPWLRKLLVFHSCFLFFAFFFLLCLELQPTIQCVKQKKKERKKGETI